MALAAGAKLGPYEIVGLLSSGGMGAVYEARDPRLGRRVAIKVLPPSFADDAARVRRFEQESRVVAMLNHPNIVTVHDVGGDAATPYLVTELLEGSTLRMHLGRPLPTDRALEYASQIARGLSAAHGKGIVHRDLKPENIFLEHSGRVKVLDFGVAKAVMPAEGSGSDTESTLTGPGLVVGTIGYMSPEQVACKPVDHRSDVFSLGAVLCEMLTGRRAFSGASPTETIAAILRDEPDLTAVTPEAVSALVRRCLAKNPDDRYQSTSDLAFQLDALSSRIPQVDRVTNPSRGRRGAMAALRIAAVAAAAGAAVAWMVSRAIAPPPATPVSYERLTFRSGIVHAGRIAPDGKTILYNATWDGAGNELFSTRLGNPESRSLGHRNADLLAISNTGELAVALHPERRGVIGGRGMLARVGLSGNTPRQLLDNVVAADWNSDGSLAAVRIVDGKSRIEFPIGTSIYETASAVPTIRISPDGASLALFEGGSVITIDRQGRRRVLTDGWFYGSNVAWSPDGVEVWFSASDVVPTLATAGIFAVTLDGKVRTVLRAPGGITILDISRDYRVLAKTGLGRKGFRFHSAVDDAERDLTWFDWGLVADISPDLKTVLFSEGGHAAERGRTTYIRGTDGSPAVRLSDGTAQTFSPGGDRVLLVRTVGNTGQLVSVPTGAGQERVVTDPGTDCDAAGWIGDGTHVVIAGRVSGQPARSYMLNANGGPLQAITPAGVTGTLVSPDGQWLLAAAAGQPFALYPIAGGPPKPIANLEADDVPVRWSVDGRSIYVRRDYQPDNPDVIDVVRVEVATGRRELWRRIRPTEFARMADLLPLAIGSDEQSYAYTYWRAAADLFLIHGLR